MFYRDVVKSSDDRKFRTYDRLLKCMVCQPDAVEADFNACQRRGLETTKVVEEGGTYSILVPVPQSRGQPIIG